MAVHIAIKQQVVLWGRDPAKVAAWLSHGAIAII